MRVLTGIQPSGSLHLGNYFGAIRPLLELQERAPGDVFLMIADLHALTSVQEPDLLRRYTLELAVDLLACGIDPGRVVLFRQSHVPAHTELAWILSCVTPMGLLERAHAYKDKVARGLPASHALFAYPVLQAADILLYDTDLVPVGKDQKQHLEIARDLATKMNEVYGPLFKLPEPLIRDEVAVVPGIDGQKMSKSYGNTIELFADEAAVRRAIGRIVTDSTPLEAPKDPDRSIVYALYRLLAAPDEAAAMATDFRRGGVGYAEFKRRLFEKFLEVFGPMRARRAELLRRPDTVREVLCHGAARARAVADEVMNRVRAAVGLTEAGTIPAPVNAGG
jgi:tryptophanyl-tRNA synthetase